MKLANLTPHEINYHAPDGQIIKFNSIGIARVDSISTDAGSFGLDSTCPCCGNDIDISCKISNGTWQCHFCGWDMDPPHQYGQLFIRLVSQSYGEISGTLAPMSGTRYIVSALVLNASKRNDLVSPCDLVRDNTGRIIGCKAFQIKKG